MTNAPTNLTPQPEATPKEAAARLADREKKTVALSSLLAAIVLTSIKLVVGILTGSLGIMAEAAHSGLDLVAALMTFLAVRVSGKPADEMHHYGHGKIENLSALFETLLLLATCGWIIYEVIGRLFRHKGADPEVTFWSFAVMISSVIIDVSRSRALKKAAIKHNSQALEADALHFETDIWSSLTVILGLICVLMGKLFPALSFLHLADALAALLVALIVIWVSYRLGMDAIQALLDKAPEELQGKIVAAAEAVPGVHDCHNVRIRPSGANLFVDIHVTVDGSQSLAAAHELTEQIEKAIAQIAPGADVTVHPEPAK